MTRTVSLRNSSSPTTPVVDIRPVIVRHLNQTELSRRWNLSARTLERWRWLGQGPQFLKIGGRVVYRLEDIEAFEAEQVRTASASTNVGGAR
jgi:hypothetical protein